MKALCNREGLMAAFDVAARVASARSLKPILQNLKLVIGQTETTSTLMASDLEVGVRCRVLGVKVDRPGAVILPTQRMRSILATSADEELALEVQDGELTVRGLHSEFVLQVEDPDLFPDVPDFDATAYHVVAAPGLREAIRRTIFATDVQSTRYALGGCLFEIADDSIALVGTDGRRLARMGKAAEAVNGAKTPAGQVVVPVKALKLLDRVLDEDDPPVHIAVQSGQTVLFKTNYAVVYSRLVEGRFPRYQDIPPTKCNARIPMQASPLLSAVSQASIVTSEETHAVDFRFDAGLLKLTTRAADVGRSSVEMPIEHQGAVIDVTMDPRYLLDALRTLESSTVVTAEFVDHKTAVVFRTEDDYMYIIMPLTRSEAETSPQTDAAKAKRPRGKKSEAAA
jgi:DNA polymerase-3 subunit beta